MESLITRSSEIIKEFQKPLDFVCDPQRETAVTMKRKSFRPRKMYLAAFAALLSALAVGIATGYSAPATFDMTSRKSSRVKPNPDEVTWIGSIVALGAMLGGLLAGRLADSIGRKDTILFNIIPFSAGWITICYANKVPVIILGRFFCGVGVGVFATTIPLYCVEISSSEVRGILGSFYHGFLVIGHLLCVTVGSIVSWDYLALTGLIVAIIAMICFLPMPETPRWYLVKNKLDDAIGAMNELQEGHVNAEKECNAIYQDLQKHSKGNITLKEFMHPTVYKPALIAIMLLFFQQFSGANAVFFYSSEIFNPAKEFMDPKKSTIVLGAVQVVATLLSNLIVDRVGRKLLLILSGATMALTLLALGAYYYVSVTHEDFKTKYDWLPLLSLIVYVIAYSIGYGPIPHLLAAELIPVRARSMVGGLSISLLGLFGFTITKTFSDLELTMKNYGAFWFYSSFNILAMIFALFVVPETKGRNLEDIEKLFRNPKQTTEDITIYTIS